MKMRFVIPMLLCAFTAFVSCSKNDDNPQPETETPGGNDNPDDTYHPGAPYFIGMIQVNGVKDTTLFRYNAKKQLVNVVMLGGDSVTGTYNSADNLSQIVVKHNDGTLSATINFSYNADNQLIRIGNKLGNTEYVDTMIYVNGVLSRRNGYEIDPAVNNGKPRNYGYDIYVVTDGNITNLKNYDNGGNFMSEATMTYNSDPNVFKTLALFNKLENLDVTDIANDLIAFNKNMVTGATTITNVQARIVNVCEYTYDDKKQLIMAVTSQTINGKLNLDYKRMFSY